MVILRIGGDVFDYDLDFLKELVELIDRHLGQLELEAKACEGPDQSGVLDRTEYVAGLGFAACQQYIGSVHSQTSLSARQALDCGPNHRMGPSIVSLVNAAANYWKHSPGWTSPSTSRRASQVVDLLATLQVDAEQSYPTVNLLHVLLSPLPARFGRLLPFLVQWRNKVCDLKA